MTDSAESEARLRRSLGNLRQEVTELVAPPPDAKDTFEDTVRSAMDRLRKLLGLG